MQYDHKAENTIRNHTRPKQANTNTVDLATHLKDV